MIFLRITVLSSIKPAIFSKWGKKKQSFHSVENFASDVHPSCLLYTLYSDVPSLQMMRGSTRPCACSVGPCSALRAPAVSVSWTGKTWGLAPPTLLSVEQEWACSSGSSLGPRDREYYFSAVKHIFDLHFIDLMLTG